MSSSQFNREEFYKKLWSASIIARFPQHVSSSRKQVYHYTTAEGLKGIVQSNSLWASGAYYLNDTSEIEYGCRLAASVLEKGFADAGTAFAEAVLRHAHTILLDPDQRKIRIVTLYVACFCEGDNLLSQWRTYSRQSGFALGFRVADLRHLQAEYTTVSVDQVLYTEQEQIQRVHSMASSALAILTDADVVRGNADDHSNDDVIHAGGEVARLLLSAVTSFKSPDFAEEREWRLVCQPYHAVDSDKINSVHKIVRFRSSARGLIPYVELAANTSTRALPIESIRFGPTQNPELARSSTRLLLDSNDFRSVKVEGSDISVALDH